MRTCASCGETETRLTAADSSHCPSEAFHDLDCTRWYHEGVDFVLRTGIMKGVGVDRFLPNGTLTRGQMVTVLYRMADEPETAETTPFTDVNMGPVSWQRHCLGG
ncbi:MAG: S-layer homology domain-containing protein [Oscillospiraceae bacterium]